MRFPVGATGANRLFRFDLLRACAACSRNFASRNCVQVCQLANRWFAVARTTRAHMFVSSKQAFLPNPGYSHRLVIVFPHGRAK